MVDRRRLTLRSSRLAAVRWPGASAPRAPRVEMSVWSAPEGRERLSERTLDGSAAASTRYHHSRRGHVVKPGKLPSFDSLATAFGQLAGASIDIELFVLRCHLIVESIMYSHLARRLQFQVADLPQLQFFPLAKLAFGGEHNRHTLSRVLALNDVRNAFSHNLETSELENQLAILAARSDVFWPPDATMAPEDLAKVKRAAVRASCFITVLNAWLDAAELYILDFQALPEGIADLQENISEARRNLEQLRQTQRQFKTLFPQINHSET